MSTIKLITKAEASKIVGLHPVSLMRLAREGKFPQPIKTGNSQNCAVRFVESEVEAWLQERMAARNDVPAA